MLHGGSRLSAFDLFILSYFILFFCTFLILSEPFVSAGKSPDLILSQQQKISKNLPLHTKYINRDGPLVSAEANINSLWIHKPGNEEVMCCHGTVYNVFALVRGL